MAVRQYKPTTPSRRGMTTQDTSAVTAKKPVKSLLVAKKRSNGRNNQGKITTRHRGGGVKRHYRVIDIKGLDGADGTVIAIEYDPNRSAHIARVELAEGQMCYMLAVNGMKVGRKVKVGEDAAVRRGNRLPLKNMPLGSVIHNIEVTRGKGGQLVRSAGGKAQLVAKEGKYAQVKLPSGEVRLIHLECYATMGSVGNLQHQNIKWGNAGRKRRMGRRPSVRGKAMNPVDHPMGGGEGQSSPGRLPRTPWGKIAIGPKTRKRKPADKLIVRSRHVGRR
jgi:large subunit ribosomal protein L2